MGIRFQTRKELSAPKEFKEIHYHWYMPEKWEDYIVTENFEDFHFWEGTENLIADANLPKWYPRYYRKWLFTRLKSKLHSIIPVKPCLLPLAVSLDSS